MKTALITGGSRGIGRAICIQLAKELEYHVLINYRSNETAATQTLQLVKENGGTGDIIQFDVADSADVVNKLDAWTNDHPDAVIEVIVNNAGITKDGLMVVMSNEDWQGVIGTSLHGFFNVTRHLLQKMLRRRYGRIINIVSLSGVKGNAGQTNYAAAKGAVVAATKSLAQEIGKRKITVNAIAPGFIKTDMTDHLDENELKRMIPLQRFGEAEEVAHLVSFLASEKSGYITGEVININGGIYS